jgi:hypothetical protein
VFVSASTDSLAKVCRLVLPLVNKKEFVLAVSPRKTRLCLDILEKHAVVG